jgi:hypothetical protein
MSDNQWIRLSAQGAGYNLAYAKAIKPLNDSVLIEWGNGRGQEFRDDEALRILAWLKEQYLPPIAP